MQNQKNQPVVLAAIQKENKFLLTLRSHHEPGDEELAGLWQLPGGGLEFGETLEEALLRECREEVGIDVIIQSVVPHVETLVRTGWHGIFIPYLCAVKDSSQPVVINEEADEYGWYTWEEIQSLKLIPVSYRILAHIMKA